MNTNANMWAWSSLIKYVDLYVLCKTNGDKGQYVAGPRSIFNP